VSDLLKTEPWDFTLKWADDVINENFITLFAKKSTAYVQYMQPRQLVGIKLFRKIEGIDRGFNWMSQR